MTKNKLERKGFYLAYTSDCCSPLKEVRAETQTEQDPGNRS